MTETLELSIPSTIESVERVSALTRRVTGKMAFDEDTSGWIELAVREAVINAIQHGNPGLQGATVDVRFVIAPDALTISIRDHGKGFVPSTVPDPREPAQLLKPSGRGILFLRTLMDDVDYCAHPQEGTVVCMSKRKTSAQ
jgi:serine/threonine-protein kinase RsbW